MRPSKSRLILMDDPLDESFLLMDNHEFRNADTVSVSYHQLENPRTHMAIAGHQFEELIIIPTSRAEIKYADEILSRVDEVMIIAEEDELRAYMDTYIKFVPEKAGSIRRAFMSKQSISDLL